MTNITVTLLSKDFENCSYGNGRDCALARAIKRDLKTDDVYVNPVSVEVDVERYDIEKGFRASQFYDLKAKFHNNEIQIHQITLIPE